MLTAERGRSLSALQIRFMNLEVLWLFFFQFLIFRKIKHSYYCGWEAKQSRINFFPNITKPGLHFNHWQPLELPFVGCSSACRGMGYLSVHFQLQREMKQVQETPARDSLWRKGVLHTAFLALPQYEEAIHWHTLGRSWETKCLFSFIEIQETHRGYTSPHCNSWTLLTGGSSQ